MLLCNYLYSINFVNTHTHTSCWLERMYAHPIAYDARKHSPLSLLLGVNGLGKIAIQGHKPVLAELAVLQFNSSDSKSRKQFTYILQGPVLSINLLCQLHSVL